MVTLPVFEVAIGAPCANPSVINAEQRLPGGSSEPAVFQNVTHSEETVRQDSAVNLRAKLRLI